MPRILQLSTNAFVEAAIQRNLSPEAIEQADNEWLAFKEQLLAQQTIEERSPEHFHWQWSRKVRFYQGRSGYEFVGLKYNERLQGIILLDYTRTARLPAQAGQPLVYIDYLATAPWNLPDFPTTPLFSGVGRALFTMAHEESLARGLRGRIGLHSLPQSESFYRNKLQMIDLGPDTRYYDLCYFEMEAK